MKICMILVDGMRPDSLAGIEDAQRILKMSSYTMTAQTVNPSVTLPCHISLFHSVDPSRHGTVTNVYTPQVRPINGLFEVLWGAKKMNALFYDWEEIRDVSRPNSLAYSEFRSGRKRGYDNTNDWLSDDAIKILGEADYDCTFIYMGLTDMVGHNSGWMSHEFLEAMKHSWKNIAKLIDTLSDEYTFIITADHGGHDRTHGSDMPEDMTIPIIFCNKSKKLPIDFDNASIKDIAPTITKLLGVEPDSDWEGKSLL